MGPLALVAIGTGGYLLGSGMTGMFNSHAQKEANRLNYQMFRENLDWQEQMMDKQNEYNLPANQMARLKAAGLNPNLVYENGGSFTPSASVGSVSSPTAQAPQVDFTGLGSEILRSMASAYQLDNLQAQTDATKAKARMDNANAYWMERYSYGGAMDDDGNIRGSLRDMYSEAEWSKLKVQKAITDFQHDHPEVIKKMATLDSKKQEELSARAAQIATLNSLDKVRKEITEIERDWMKQNKESGLDPRSGATVKLVNNLMQHWHDMDFGDKFQSIMLILVSSLSNHNKY